MSLKSTDTQGTILQNTSTIYTPSFGTELKDQNLSEQELDKLFKHSPKLQTGYRLCRQLTSIYNSKIGRRPATNKINRWIEKVEESDLECINRFIGTLQKYKSHIIQYFNVLSTSGYVE